MIHTFRQEFILNNRDTIVKILTPFFEKTILKGNEKKVVNQLIDAYIKNQPGKEFIEKLFSVKATSKEFMNKIPINLRKQDRILAYDASGKKVMGTSDMSFEHIKKEFLDLYIPYKKQIQKVTKPKPPKRMFGSNKKVRPLA